jgi:hypothetical protein
LLVTQICTLRLIHVVVPMAAHTAAGRREWSSSVRLRCVAGQQIACSARRRMSVASGG